MAIYLNSQGKEFNLSQKLGHGGEGVVYSCAEDPGLVAKIYHEPIDEAKAVKLRWMAANRDEQLLKISAWVVDVLTDPASGQVAGFLMPTVQAKEVHELYALKSRRVHFPRANWSFLIHAATNIARAFFVLHKHGHVMGDVNHGNCVVLPDGRVRLIDCDSYSIKTDAMRYRCDVGVATHLPPELQGRDLSTIDRTKNHDNFGLAVMIFQLLFLGRHPFAGNFQGSEDKSLEDCIREHRFAYSYDITATRVSQPPGTLCLDELTPRLAEMFEQSFMSLSRPQAGQWVEALEDLSGSLKSCKAHIGHHFYEGLKSCPWCRIERSAGVTVFPFTGNDDSLDVFSVESLLASLNVPEKLPVKIPKAATPSSPSQVILDLQNEELLKFVGFIVFQLAVVIIAAAISGLTAALFTGIFSCSDLSRLCLFDQKHPRRTRQGRIRGAKGGLDFDKNGMGLLNAPALVLMRR
jgi:DNA-binding helix-hairpin-helix protein with protein kinase domain